MKKSLFTLAILAFSAGVTFAQGVSLKSQATTATSSATDVDKNLEFVKTVHDFGELKEGDPATYVFKFKNISKSPVIIEKATATCGCTVPTPSKDPIAPGKMGEVSVSYSTQGRPGPINRNITIVTSAGTKVVTIKGNVAKANAAPASKATSMIKTKK